MGLGCVETPGERPHEDVSVVEARWFFGSMLCRHRRHERSDTHDVHDAGQIVGQDVQRRL